MYLGLRFVFLALFVLSFSDITTKFLRPRKYNCLLFLFFFSDSKGVYGLLAIPAGLVFLVGILLKEPETHNFRNQQVLNPTVYYLVLYFDQCLNF